jgi:hypothetical protein
MEALIPAIDRKSEWKQLGKSLGWELPALVRPDWVGYTFLGLFVSWLAILFVVWARVAGFALEAVIPIGIGFVVGAVPLAGLLFHLTEPLAIHIPPHCSDVRSMVTTILGRKFEKIRDKDQAGWNRK